jgi:hypothetical protein
MSTVPAAVPAAVPASALVAEAMSLIHEGLFEEARRLFGDKIGEVDGGRILRFIEEQEAEEAAKAVAEEAERRRIERLEMLTPFALPEGFVLPPAIHASFQEFGEAEQHAHAAGIFLRFAFTAAKVDVGDAAAHAHGWWSAQTPEARKKVEDLALIEGVQVCDSMEAFAGEPVEHDVLESFALNQDAFYSVTTLLWHVEAGAEVRRIEGGMRSECSAFLAAQPAAGPWKSPLLAAWARRCRAWWVVAPGEEPPDLDADAFDVDDEDNDGDGWLDDGDGWLDDEE